MLLAVMAIVVLAPALTVWGWSSTPHLTPEGGTFVGDDPYERAVREVLCANTFAGLFRAVVLPSFSSEWVIVVHKPEGGTARVELRVAAEPIWPRYERVPRPSYREYSAEVPESVARALTAAVQRALRLTRYPPSDNTGAGDGVTYHFASFVLGDGDLAGQVWSPPEESDAGKLVAILDTLRTTLEKQKAIDNRVRERLLSLSKQIAPQ
jgi:hypothetical protein